MKPIAFFYRLFNLHPEKWFEGYPVKSTQIFLGCHLRFFRVASTQIFFRMRPGSLKKAGFHTCKSEKKSSEYPIKIRAWRHPIKIWVDFTGYPSNHFSGCRLNGRIYHDTFLKQLSQGQNRKRKCVKIHSLEDWGIRHETVSFRCERS